MRWMAFKTGPTIPLLEDVCAGLPPKCGSLLPVLDSGLGLLLLMECAGHEVL